MPRAGAQIPNRREARQWPRALASGRQKAYFLGSGQTREDFVDFYSSRGLFPSPLFNLQGLFQHSSDFTPAPEKERPFLP